MRWERDKDLLFVQWNDNKPVTLLSSIQDANTNYVAQRRSKEKGGGEFKNYKLTNHKL